MKIFIELGKNSSYEKQKQKQKKLFLNSFLDISSFTIVVDDDNDGGFFFLFGSLFCIFG